MFFCAAKSFSYAGGSGTPLGDIPFYRHASDKMTTDDDALIMLHSLFFGSAGKSTMRKRQLRVFSGFPETSSRAKVVEKVMKSKKWTVAMLKSCADLFGMEKGGTRDDLVERFVDFVSCPSELKDVPVSKAKKASKKRKAGKKNTKKDKSDKPKRAPSAFILYSQSAREGVKAENPEAGFGEVAKLLGAAWKALGDDERAVWMTTAAEAAETMDGGNKKRRKTTEDSKEGADEESDDDEDDDDEESEEEEDRDKDLFPDSDEEA